MTQSELAMTPSSARSLAILDGASSLRRATSLTRPSVWNGFDAAPGHRAGEFVDVDVHTACTADARLQQRGRVQSQVSDPLDHGNLPSRTASGRSTAPSRYLYSSSPLRKSKRCNPSLIDRSIIIASNTIPGEASETSLA